MAARCPRKPEPKFRFLYLGNDLDFMTALKTALTEVDHRLVSCGHGEHARWFLRSETPYDLLLVDFDWQGAEGLKLAEFTRSLRHRKRMPILLVAAGELNNELKTLAGKARVKKCLAKTPVDAVSEAIREMTPG